MKKKPAMVSTLTIRIDRETLEELKALADRNDRPVSYEVRKALLAWLAKARNG